MQFTSIQLQDAPKVPFNLDGKIMHTSNKLELVHLTLKPGEKIGKHPQPFDVVFYILSGIAILETDTEEIEVKENTSIFVPAGIQRGWNNTGPADFKLLVIKDLA
jgi:mannose-6-phosphate isomerase-like protein (cupin superfamily)